MKEINLNEINEQITAAPEQFVIDCEAQYDRTLRSLADDICRHASEKPIVLISGPSGSGKTSTACRLEQILDAAGFESHTLSMDNYYADGARNLDVVDQFGKPDFESPLRLDTELLNEQLRLIALGQPVELPRFDFTEQKQHRNTGVIFHRKAHEILIMEGIHALNPDLTGCAGSHAFRIYLSVRTRITKEHTQLHPSLVRFARRLIRDGRTRGRSPEDSAKLLTSISRGENLYIMPFKHLADYELDTFMGYELSVYKPFLMDTVRELAPAMPAETNMKLLAEVMEALEPAETDWIPEQSIIREFIGGSVFTG